MRRFAHDIPQQETCQYDICVVGSGPAAFALALQFVQQGDRPQRVAMLESSPQRYNQNDIYGVKPPGDFDVQELYRGTVEGWLAKDPSEYLSSSRLRRFGGTSRHWGGWCWPFDETDFEKWPISFNDLAPHYLKAQKLCRLDDFVYDDPQHWVEKLHWEKLEEMPLAGHPLRTRMLQFNAVNFGETYKGEIDSSPWVDLYRNANLVGLETSPDGSGQRVTRARVQSILNGQPQPPVFFEAKFFVIAAGIESTRILLLSGLGNPGHVGRNFIEHLYLWTGAKFKMTSKIPSGVKRLYFSSNQISSGNSYGTTILGTLVPRPEYLKEKNLGNFRVMLGGFNGVPETINTRWEQAPNPESFLRLSDDPEDVDLLGQRRLVANLKTQPVDGATVKDLLVTTRGVLSDLGYGVDFKLPDLAQDPFAWKQPGRITPGLHPMGATRMSSTPEDGVVSPHCKVWGTTNLYVASSSTFPTGGYANPTLTIVAMAIRIAEHLKTNPPC